MFRPTCAAILLSTTLLAGAASAQTAAPAAGTTAGSGNFVTVQGTSDFRASKFVGVDIYGSEGEKIGDISEVLLDTDGKAKAIVIGVGGFLGMGQKNVAVPWSAVTWSMEPMASRTSSSADRPATTASTGAATTATGPATTPTAPTMGGTAAPARPAATSAAPMRSAAEQAAYNGYPDHGKVSLSKAQLQEAPEFKYVADSGSSAPAKR